MYSCTVQLGIEMLSYLRRVTRIDSCRDATSVRTTLDSATSTSSLEHCSGNNSLHHRHHNHSRHHHQPQHSEEEQRIRPLPEVRLVSASLGSVAGTPAPSPVPSVRSNIENISQTSTTATLDGDHQQSASEQCQNLLLVSRTRLTSLSPCRVSKKSSSSGFRSAASVRDCDSSNSSNPPLSNEALDTMTELGRSFQTRSRRRVENVEQSATSPTTICPTIASALWRPLWPPGWHPRSSSTATPPVNLTGQAQQQQQHSNITTQPSSQECQIGGRSVRSSSTNTTSTSTIGLLNRALSMAESMLEPNNNSQQEGAGGGGQTNNYNYKQLKLKMGVACRGVVSSSTGMETANVHSTNDRSRAPNASNSAHYDSFVEEQNAAMEDWLDEHPAFVHSYFIRKASRTLIDSWLMAHSSSSAIAPNGPNNTNASGNMIFANQSGILANQDNSGANTPVRKISAHEFESSSGGFLRPMVSTTTDGTPTFLPIDDHNRRERRNSKKDGPPKGDGQTVGRTIPPLAHSLSATTIANVYNAIENGQNPLFGSPRRASQSQGTLVEGVISGSSPVSPQSGRFSNVLRPALTSVMMPADSEREMIFELVKDICNDLEVRSLCHKILKNVGTLTGADRCSLFLVCGEENERYLASHLFDVSAKSTVEQMAPKEEITIPWGTGIVGYVAETGTPVNIPDCYSDSRFTDEIDQKTGYKTKNMLCHPILDTDGEVMGVAQVINKQGSAYFTPADQVVFNKYLQFCGIGIRNAQLYERSQLENRRNQVLLDLARMVFEKQSNIESIIFRILLHIISLLQCERAQVLLLTEPSTDSDFYYYGRTYQDPYAYFNMLPSSSTITVKSPPETVASSSSLASDRSGTPPPSEIRSFSRVFDLESHDLLDEHFEETRQTPFEGRFPTNIGLTGYVAMTGETLNIPDAYQDSRFDRIVDEGAPHNFRHHSVLCMPIRNATGKIIGVAQLVNKLNDRPFNKNDENLFEAFAIFSGMGIENTQMFEKAVKAMAKQKVTLELLSYHASAHTSEASKFARMLIPSTATMSLTNLRFDDFCLDDDEMIQACIRMFLDLDLIERFHIDYKVLCKWILSVRKNYRPVLYHNWRHAFNVAQMMFAILVNTNLCLVLGELETLALIVACLCHDLDHRGTNNSFQIKTSSPLAQLYSTSTLEHHHFDQSLMILNSEGNQILSNLSPDEYRHVVAVLEEAILATDLAMYFKNRDEFFGMVNNDTYEWSSDSHRAMLRSMLMTCCDIAAITKPWETQKIVAELVASEFYDQGDIEKEQLNIEPSDMMNREKIAELPKMQLSFIDGICLPVYEAFAKLCPGQLRSLLKGVESNRDAWTLLSNKPYELTLHSHMDAHEHNGDINSESIED